MEKLRLFSRLLLVCLCFCAIKTQAVETMYWMDAGLTVGTDYYSGDARSIKAPDLYIFRNPQPNIGLQMRFKLSRRFAVVLKSQFDNIKFDLAYNLQDVQIVNTDVTCEYNFFRFGQRLYDDRIRPFTPYMFLGLGFGCFGNEYKLGSRNALYVPFGIGLKWNFANRCTLVASWQHQLYFSDSLEEPESVKGSRFNDPNQLNGANWFNRDLMGSFNVGMTFSFWKHKKPCVWCKD